MKCRNIFNDLKYELNLIRSRRRLRASNAGLSIFNFDREMHSLSHVSQTVEVGRSMLVVRCIFFQFTKDYRIVKLLICISLFFCANLEAGNFPQDFKSARSLMMKGKFTEAGKAFLTLSRKGYRRKRCRDEAFFGAASCAIAQKEFEKAAKLALKIKDPHMRLLSQMEAFEAQRKPDDILRISRNEDLTLWPDRLIHTASMRRGRANDAKRNAEAAEKDYLLARNSTMDANDLAFANVALGKLYLNTLKNKEKALEAFAIVAKLPARLGIKSEGVSDYAIMLANRGEGEKAMAVLRERDIKNIKTPYWKCRLFRCAGDVQRIINNKKKALFYYDKAIAVQNAPANMVDDVKEKITKLAIDK